MSAWDRKVQEDAVLWLRLWSKWLSQTQRSGSGFDASRSAIARVDSKCGCTNRGIECRRCERRY